MKRKTIIIIASIVAGLAALFFVADKTAEAIVRHQIEKQIAGSGVAVDLGRVAVNLPRRSISLHNTRIKLQHDDATTPAKGIIALDAVIDLAQARGVSWKNKQINARSITLDLGNATLALAGKTGITTLLEVGPTEVSVDGMKTASVAIDSLAVAFGDHVDKTRVSLHTLSLAGVSIDSLLAPKHSLIVDSIVVEHTAVVSSKNRKMHETPRIKPLLWQSVQRLPIDVDIARVRYNDLDITYSELAPEAASYGTVSITNGHGTVENLTNIVGSHRFFTIDLSATLMNAGQMTANAEFPIDSLDNHWQMTGRIGRSDLSAFNAATEPLTNVRITRGTIERLDYRIEGTRTQSHVWMTMRYRDLAVEMLRADDHSRRRGLLTFALNDILIRDANPGAGGRLRTGEGTTQRDPGRSMYNFIWRSLIPGIKQTAL